MITATQIPETVTIHVPFRIVRRGGRKEMVLPEDTRPGSAKRRRPDNTLVKALARAFRWKRMLESGEFATIKDIARQEGIAASYVARLFQLTALAPDIVDAILDGTEDLALSVELLRRQLPDDWVEQRKTLNRRRMTG